MNYLEKSQFPALGSPSLKKSLTPLYSGVLIGVDNIPVEIEESCLNKIKYTLKKVPNTEWSGIIFYQLVGSFSDIPNLKIVVKDLFVMNVSNSSSYTEYQFNKDAVNYIVSNNLLELMPGHLHSHNKMSTFFSQTDTDELKENCTNFNSYLSIIVNNALDFSAKFVVEVESVSNLKITTPDGIHQSKEHVTKKYYEIDCIVDTSMILSIDEEFSKRIEFLIKEASRVSVNYGYGNPNSNYRGSNSGFRQGKSYVDSPVLREILTIGDSETVYEGLEAIIEEMNADREAIIEDIVNNIIILSSAADNTFAKVKVIYESEKHRYYFGKYIKVLNAVDEAMKQVHILFNPE